MENVRTAIPISDHATAHWIRIVAVSIAAHNLNPAYDAIAAMVRIVVMTLGSDVREYDL